MLTRAAPWRAFGNADVQGAVGVGAAMQRRLVGNGITLIGHPPVPGEREFATRYGRVGERLGRLACGEDAPPSMPTPLRIRSPRKPP